MIARVIAGAYRKVFRQRANSPAPGIPGTKGSHTGPRERARAERKPWYCSGCPHNTSTSGARGQYRVRWAVSAVTTWRPGWIAVLKPSPRWVAKALPGSARHRFTERKHVFQNLGDGTYFHSGLLAIRAAVAAGVNITYKILYNDAVAMTGGQPVDGQLSVVQIDRPAARRGCQTHRAWCPTSRRYIATKVSTLAARALAVTHRNQLEVVQIALRDTEGLQRRWSTRKPAPPKSAAVARKACSTDPPKHVLINDAVCEGCGDCGVQVQLPVDHSPGRPGWDANAISTKAPATRITPACAVSVPVS